MGAHEGGVRSGYNFDLLVDVGPSASGYVVRPRRTSDKGNPIIGWDLANFTFVGTSWLKNHYDARRGMSKGENALYLDGHVQWIKLGESGYRQ